VREIEVHVNMGMPVATIAKYVFKRKKLYIAICHLCARGSSIAVIASTRLFNVAKQTLEQHLARHELDYNYVLKVVVTSGKSRVVEIARYYYLATLHTYKIELEALIKGYSARS
jgi:DNA-binding transcriptional ArsR family regulator